MGVGLFTEMVASGIKLNSTTLASILASFLELRLLRYEKIHCFSLRNGPEHSDFVVSALGDQKFCF